MEKILRKFINFLYPPKKDELFDDAVKVVAKYDQIGVSLIQRELKVGYARGDEILNQLQLEQPDYVLDFHTTSAKTPPFAIITDPKMLNFAKTLGLNHIILMKHNIKAGHALINHYNGVSVEAGTHNSPEAFENVIRIVNSATKGEKHTAILYEVYGLIETPGKYINFVKHSDNFIPILAGERAYDFYGLKARIVNSFS